MRLGGGFGRRLLCLLGCCCCLVRHLLVRLLCLPRRILLGVLRANTPAKVTHDRLHEERCEVFDRDALRICVELKLAMLPNSTADEHLDARHGLGLAIDDLLCGSTHQAYVGRLDLATRVGAARPMDAHAAINFATLLHLQSTIYIARACARTFVRMCASVHALVHVRVDACLCARKDACVRVDACLLRYALRVVLGLDYGQATELCARAADEVADDVARVGSQARIAMEAWLSEKSCQVLILDIW
mmetsp:Transcript_82630/g.164904  ORF Transcript_82630/g.164904 Transcript_82630/m.164904 type:complete len:246 (-) Transcript_82630:1441-2178(-)